MTPVTGATASTSAADMLTTALFEARLVKTTVKTTKAAIKRVWELPGVASDERLCSKNRPSPSSRSAITLPSASAEAMRLKVPQSTPLTASPQVRTNWRFCQFTGIRKSEVATRIAVTDQSSRASSHTAAGCPGATRRAKSGRVHRKMAEARAAAVIFSPGRSGPSLRSASSANVVETFHPDSCGRRTYRITRYIAPMAATATGKKTSTQGRKPIR